MLSTEDQASSGNKIGRRAFVAGGLAGAAALLADPAGAAAADTGPWLTYESSSPDGASVSYPAAWEIDGGSSLNASFDPHLLYPHQSFGLRTIPAMPGYDVGKPSSSGLPDLTNYPPNAAVIWLMYYDDVVDNSTLPFPLSLAELRQMNPSNFPAFQSYVGSFSNQARSFLLRAWIGTRASAATQANVEACIASIRVP